MSNKNSQKKKHSRLRNRRAVADIISTMMLMGVTVTGASTLTYFMNDAFVSGNLGAVSSLESSSLNLVLLAYDTRDSSDLLDIPTIDNALNLLLCGDSCNTNPNFIPLNGGTEFIIFQIQNNGLDTMYLEDVVLNSVSYSWDLSTSLKQLDASANDSSGKYPSAGMFSILPVGSTPIQNENMQIQAGQTVNILVKLSSDNPDIELNQGIQLSLNTGSIHLEKFVINSGDAR